MAGTLRLVMGDQLSQELSALSDVDPGRDAVLMAEVAEETDYVSHHTQKLVFILSAMRHFADSLSRKGLNVIYVNLDEEGNRGSFTGEVERALECTGANRIVLTEPSEYRVSRIVSSWSNRFAVPVEVRQDDRFLCSTAEFADWASGRKSLRMEFFYREMRRKTGWLMNGPAPVGGKWNYDTMNRRPVKGKMDLPGRKRFPPDDVTRQVIRLVQTKFGDRFGSLESFGWAATREHALAALQDFLDVGLGSFGDFQDAMASDADFLFHSLLSPYINVGLLGPREVCEAVLRFAEKEDVPLNAVEGFIRQILGWREFVRGIYWQRMPSYRETNFLAANRPLPSFYWTGETPMRCIRETVAGTRRNAYAHHIQRLMITGNFALLAGLSPPQVEEWYLAVYADAFEWVELPNTHGMALHADGGLLGSKPYAASGAYIDRMSDYCRNCRYEPKHKLGPKACPFNYLYWHFLIVNESRLKSNPRMGLPYRTLANMDTDRKNRIMNDAESFLAGLDE